MFVDQQDAPAPEADGVNPAPSPEPTNTQDVQHPPSSNGEPGAEKQDLLSVVMSVAPPKVDDSGNPLPAADPKPEATSEPAADPSKDGDADKPSQEEADPTDDELKAYTPNAQKRIRALVAKRNEFRQEVEALKPAAEAFQGIQSWLRDNDITHEDYETLLGLGAALRKGDFQTFLDGLRPYVEVAEQALGLRLPPELQEQVDAGLVPEDTARAAAKDRFTAARLAEELKNREERDTVQSRQAAAQAMSTAVAEWESGIRATDPDYGRKAEAVQVYTRAMLAEKGAPKTPQEAVATAKAAYEKVNETFAQSRPAPQPTAPKPGAHGQSPAPARTEPKSLMEAAMAGLQASRAS